MSSLVTPLRFASGFVAKQVRGFQVLRIDGYSWTKALPGGERITSDAFALGGRHWCVDYYPNGADASKDESDSIALYLRLMGAGGYHYHHQQKQRVKAEYKFSLLDLAGNAAFERPAESGIVTSDLMMPHHPRTRYSCGLEADAAPGGQQAAAADVRCGYAAFIVREELERRRDSLLKEDCLAIRCDVGVTEVTPLSGVGPNPMPPGIVHPPRHGYNHGGDDELDAWDGSHRRQEPPPDDQEYIRRRLSGKRSRSRE